MVAKKGNRYSAEGRGKTPLQRFAEKCAFDPFTGCVMWVGAQTSGHGHNQPYGRFWFEGEAWLAHRWAAIHIHKQNVGSLQVDHCCPAGPSTLCVQHLQPVTLAENVELQQTRNNHRCAQSLVTAQYWLFVSKGIEEYQEPPPRQPGDIPFYTPPDWLVPFLKTEALQECPF